MLTTHEVLSVAHIREQLLLKAVLGPLTDAVLAEVEAEMDLARVHGIAYDQGRMLSATWAAIADIASDLATAEAQLANQAVTG